MTYPGGDYDIVVIGAGHAGVEAALASARIGQKTLLLTINLDSVAMMPCNPSIGGTGKGHLVREIDALGGEMGKTIDATMIQCKMLNTAKGPAVHSLRAQADKKAYQFRMKEVIENQVNLLLKQQEATEIIVKDGKITGVMVNTGAIYNARAVIICSGTYLKGRIIIGDVKYDSGPNGLFPAMYLSDSLEKNGIALQRFKTGTPARVDAKTLDYTKMIIQEGDAHIVPFSFETEKIEIDQVPCYLTYTNAETHDIINANIERSPLYTGDVVGIGPRYCPSIETKVMRFHDKERHQIFMEPEGLNTNEIYVQGMSSCLPEEVQIALYRTVPGMEEVEFMRSAYAIEYDCIHPTRLKASLESKEVTGLFFAGQINGTSGYEEAAAQGLIAGINASLYLRGEQPVIIDRSEGYIGVLIDDIITKGIDEPYRMMTSRAEYRLLLRQDNADLRLTEIGYRVGLIAEARYQRFLEKKEQIKQEIVRLSQVVVKPNQENNAMLKSFSSSEIEHGLPIGELLRRPEIKYLQTEVFDPERPALHWSVVEQVEVQIKYEGYIKKQLLQVEQFKKLEHKLIPQALDYAKIGGLRIEAAEKLQEIKPLSIGQASRISGVSPADISVLLIALEQRRRNSDKEGTDHE
ncbi:MULTISPECIES: tRNA uridine-5-carboxymethylaminomethyl(34) synthesis enzyme MnmG [unclassified Acetobacterium]|jgi:tRNA uridine 5-carboxymethylaminomethyl modification enzyme|uniref:tRNA uridine-5-carboxymethylaminomethyl(34) synthesis enzyme MnmG n=1 Tax=unclassified Acetobacterium TaxID=2638182 RepID=UPI000DBEB33F|nr:MULTISPECIES: tRNA uridine-5-carboxymethylaminomethyl(34) synthesis enzyme MnmG [unclassified Acetobacterium]AWW27349.1 tRNA uridine-5-carboxymethylaminomethyl(34) synthesis enzyme MnmG [Acetobacterium sp. KB-1]MDZ5725484.1 tRNA uridine-5-carboxymethylaminomethyl(34) synthesis enzyme MnmG [Acetobacterium sp. K1/6]